MQIDFKKLSQEEINNIKEIKVKISIEKKSFRTYGTSRINNKDLISLYEGLETTSELLIKAMEFILDSQKELDF